LCDMFLRASKLYSEHNYSLSLILDWAIVERMLQELWTKYIDDNRTRDGAVFINIKRRDRLRDKRTFSAAVIIKTLSLVDYLTLELSAKLSAIRKIRNDWIHGLGTTATRENAEIATSCAEDMLAIVRRIRLTGARGLRIHG
jgi:hypothetical protein